jgi:hypothetical protein
MFNDRPGMTFSSKLHTNNWALQKIHQVTYNEKHENLSKIHRTYKQAIKIAPWNHKQRKR